MTPFPTRILHLAIDLRLQSRAMNERNVEALKSSGAAWFSHILVAVLSWQDSPDAPAHPLVNSIRMIARSHGQKLIWTRMLSTYDRRVSPGAYMDPMFYAAAIARVRGEASAMGCLCGLECEPYPETVCGWLRDATLSIDRQSEMMAAIAGGVMAAGGVMPPCGVDYVYPGQSGRASSYVWPLRFLADRSIDSMTYLVKPPQAGLPGYNVPPLGLPRGWGSRREVWASYVGLGRAVDNVGGAPLLTPAMVQQLDFDRCRQISGECEALSVYAEPQIIADVLGKWYA